MSLSTTRDNIYQRVKNYRAMREPVPVKRDNWLRRDGLPPLCRIHEGEVAAWTANKARESGGQWACKSCARDKSRGLRRYWKTEHTDPFTYNLKRSFCAAKSSSKKVGREFSLTFDDIIAMWGRQNGCCAISGLKMNFLPGNKSRNRRKVTMDRKDSTRGYTLDNVWLVCDWVNRAKTDMTKDEAKLFALGILRSFVGDT